MRDNQMQKASLRTPPTETKATCQYQNTVLPPQQVPDTANKPEKQELDIKSHIMILIEDFKKDITPLKKYRTAWVNR